MLTINIICIGKLKEKYLKDGVAEYVKRIQAFCKINIIELDEDRLPDNPSASSIASCVENEGQKILSKIPNGAYVYSMCIEGKQLSSEELAKSFEDIAISGKSTICFIIGGSYGLWDQIKKISNYKLSMSKMTFPHQLARVMLCEQIYRSFQIINNGKYHK